MIQEPSVPWSPDLRCQTLTALQSPHITPDALIHMKHKQQGYGHFLIVDVLAGRLHLHRSGQETPALFDSPEAVLAAGWALD